MGRNEADVFCCRCYALIDDDDSPWKYFTDEQRLLPSSTVDCENAILDCDESLHRPNDSKVNTSDVRYISKELTFCVTCNQRKVRLSRKTKSGAGWVDPGSGNFKWVFRWYSGIIIEIEQDFKEWTYYQTVLRAKVKIRFVLSCSQVYFKMMTKNFPAYPEKFIVQDKGTTRMRNSYMLIFPINNFY